MTTNGTASVNGDEGEVVLRDLQSLLLKHFGNEVKVIDYKTSMLLPKGENYASTMLKVEAVIKRTKNSAEEKLHLVAKMIPISEFQKLHFNITASFVKEIYVFEKLGRYYRDLEREAGVEDTKLFDLLPKIYGGRLSRNEESLDKADNDAVMLLENLKVRGYDTMNRMKGLDFEHARLAITELARYHALGMALKYTKPMLFKEVRKPINVFPFDMKTKEFDDVADFTLETICKDSRIGKYKERITKSMESSKGFESFMNTEEIEPWVTITHGDFWVNNIMFHHAENGKVDDVKFVDFQMARVANPLTDLPYFLCASTSAEVMDNHFDDLLDAYHTRFVEVLGNCGCDVSPFTKKNFEEQLRRVAHDELFHCIMALKFFTLQVAQDLDMNDMKSSIMLTDASSLYIERSFKLVNKFVEKGWI